jgi:hypothetical protein
MVHAVLGCALMVAIRIVVGGYHWPIALVLAVAAYAAVVLPLVLPFLKGRAEPLRRSSNAADGIDRRVTFPAPKEEAKPCGSL